MKTFAFLTLAAAAGISVAGCADDFCDKVDCEGSGGGGTTSSSASTDTGPGTTASTSSSQPTSSSTDSGSSGGGDGGASGSSSSSETGGGAGGEGGGGAPPGCELVDDEPVTGEDCAIFVNGEHEGDESGTRSAPYRTIGQAVAVAGNEGKAIYVCSDVAYNEAIEITESMRLVGGFGCESWTWTEIGRTAWTAEADAIPLRVANGASVSIVNFTITAADADEATEGGSSIAVLVSASDLTLTRSDLVAGNGSDGAEGAFLPGAGPAPDGNDGNDGCSGGNVGAAADGGANECDGSDRSGGLSGQGTTVANGIAGSPGNPEEAGVNIGGARQSGSPCGNGGPGSDGGDGDPGIGAVGLGQLTATGFIPESGSAGTSGMPGYGGGGGGGGRVCMNGLVGPSGGGGGAGGCGGTPGAVGNGAGASIALALVNATVTFDEATLAVGNGGRGGNGAAGQPGQSGGGGGQDGNVEPSGQGTQACLGGPGGDGGNGGPGGGGRGGHAFGIAWSGGNAPSEDGVTFAGGGSAGDGGERVDLAEEGRGFDGIEEDVFEIE